MNQLPADSHAREQALHPGKSFIIQAPAGSGKTGLLIRRYLTLLAVVQSPEEVLAITFTRKATAEMRRRIISALNGVDENGKPEKDDTLNKLATAARANDAKYDWQLSLNTRRLRVQTIDSFCSELVHRMPWSARFGGTPNIIEDATQLYLEAARQTLGYIEDKNDPELADACAVLLDLMNANFQDSSKLLGGMLAKRDKWMRLMHGNDRNRIEGFWQQTIDQSLKNLDRILDKTWKEEMLQLTQFAATNLANADESANSSYSDALEHWLTVEKFPRPDHRNIHLWRSLVGLLLTKDGSVRSRITKLEGFPADQKQWKQRMLDLLEHTRLNIPLQGELAHVAILPHGTLSDEQWRSTKAILKLLSISAAQLKLLFREQNVADYTELAQRAELALGDADSPSDLALVFDHRLQHVLMDEFQDTSIGQVDLITKLLEGWQVGDGRSVFFVGDPMQSIYRFREAEVANFLTVQQNGIAQIEPEALSLEVNFRSNANLVNWFNQCFSTVMPVDSDVVRGAVHYSQAISFGDPDPSSSVTIHPTLYCAGDDISSIAEGESQTIADLIERVLQTNPEQSIAVLGRTRNSLNAVAIAFDQRNIPFQGIKLQRLSERQAIQDLLHLARAIIQPGDRSAWISLMRMPWCGLPINDVTTLCEGNSSKRLLDIWLELKQLDKLSKDSRNRLTQLANHMALALSRRERIPLWQNLEATWLALGGPAAVDRNDIDDCRRFIVLVRELEQSQLAVTPENLNLALEQLWATGSCQSNIQLLTIHAAKGLQFDTVILPNLERSPRASDRDLLRFANLQDRLLIAAKPSSMIGRDLMFDYLRELEKEQLRNEARRLLYVACTRAKHNLHLFGTVKFDESKGLCKPPANSLLGLLWPVVQQDYLIFSENNPNNSAEEQHHITKTVYPLVRFPKEWQPAPLEHSIYAKGQDIETSASQDEIIFDWASEISRICGVVIHQIFQLIDAKGWLTWKNQSISNPQKILWRNRLLEKGIPMDSIENALNQVCTAVLNAKQDDQAEWIFSSTHQDVRTEWPVTGVIDGKILHQIIDRSFIDENGIRWIIDFKSSRHQQSENLEQFMDQEIQRYRPILERYAKIVSQLENVAVRTALYYPVLKRFELL